MRRETSLGIRLQKATRRATERSNRYRISVNFRAHPKRFLWRTFDPMRHLDRSTGRAGAAVDQETLNHLPVTLWAAFLRLIEVRKLFIEFWKLVTHFILPSK